MQFQISPHFGFILLELVVIQFMLLWKGFMTGQARKKYGVPLPDAYAVKGVTGKRGEGEEHQFLLTSDENCDRFNCYQRAHQNTLEHVPTFVALLITGGLAFPITTAIGGLVWIAGRITFAVGYYTGNPKARLFGIFFLLGLLIVVGANITFATKLFMAM
eukprot:GHVO01018525.1.p2 GENE.GHVO01018525.1~~GHVO01018525.1.p2  ORF type:complete len:171 (-),score=6.75 GHVO01018525.1:909-1388(-)